MKKSDKRADIMQAALELIAERGFHAATMGEIAAKAGVAAGTIYLYFDNKDMIITELHQELEEKIMKVLHDGYPLGKSVRERFFYMFRESLQYLIVRPLHFRYMEQYFNSPYGISMRRDGLFGKPGNHDDQDILRDIFEEGISHQILKDFPVVVLFSLAIGPMVSLIRNHTLGIITLDEALIKQITKACWDGIKR